MGPRQLTFIFGVSTAGIALVIAACRMMLRLNPLVGVLCTAGLYVLASAALVMMSRKKREHNSMDMFVLLSFSSIVCALVYAIAYPYLQHLFPASRAGYDVFFVALFLVNSVPRLIIDAVAAIFYKR